MTNIKVSVIVPVYNVEKYVGDCLDSLEKQTLDDIEIIIVNDGSTDNSDSIIQKYVSRNNNFTVIEQCNKGLSAARNAGLEIAKGEYVYFLDSDDYILKTTLEQLYVKAKKNNLDVLKFVAFTLEELSNELNWNVNSGYKYKGEYLNVYNGMELLGKFIDNDDTGYPSCCLMLIKRATIEKEHLRFYEGIIHEDNLFHWQVMSISERVMVLNEPLYCRRIRNGSITQTIDWMRKNKAMCVTTEEMEAFLIKHPELEGKTSDWYVMSFINAMICNWQNMSPDIKSSQENKQYFDRVRKIAKKHNYGDNIFICIYMKNVMLFRIITFFYNNIIQIIRKK